MTSLCRSSARRGLVTIAWTRQPARAQDLADALGGICFASSGPAWLPRAPLPARYAWLSLWTIGVLVRTRPATVVVQNPPVVPGLISLGYAVIARARVAIDAHPASFGAKGDRIYQLLLPLSRWTSRRATCTFVTVPRLVSVVDGWGGRGLVVHEPPPRELTSPAPVVSARTDAVDVLYVCVFAPDEPVWPVLEAARLNPSVTYGITGNLSRAPEGFRENVPPNVRLLGFMPIAEFYQLLRQAKVVLTLTSAQDSVMRSAYEAVYAGRPLVLSSLPHLRALFPDSSHVRSDPHDIAAAVEHLLADPTSAEASAARARQTQLDRWREQLTDVQTCIERQDPAISKNIVKAWSVAPRQWLGHWLKGGRR